MLCCSAVIAEAAETSKFVSAVVSGYMSGSKGGLQLANDAQWKHDQLVRVTIDNQ